MKLLSPEAGGMVVEIITVTRETFFIHIHLYNHMVDRKVGEIINLSQTRTWPFVETLNLRGWLGHWIYYSSSHSAKD